MKTRDRNLLLRRAGGELDQIFIYFMRTALRIQKEGIVRLPLPNPLEREPLRCFLEDRKSTRLNSSH